MAKDSKLARVSTMLVDIGRAIAEQHGSVRNKQIVEAFGANIERLDEAEKLELIGIGLRVLTGRLTSKKSSKSNNKDLLGYNFPDFIGLDSVDDSGKITRSNYMVDQLTAGQLLKHQKPMKTTKKVNSPTKYELLIEAAKDVQEKGLPDNTIVLEYMKSGGAH